MEVGDYAPYRTHEIIQFCQAAETAGKHAGPMQPESLRHRKPMSARVT